jgi:hypothetical protein
MWFWEDKPNIEERENNLKLNNEKIIRSRKKIPQFEIK